MSAADIPIPGVVTTLWRSLAFAYRAEPPVVLVTAAGTVLNAVPDALFALWLKLLADGVVGGRPDLVLVAALGLAASVTASWFVQTVVQRLSRRFQLRLGVALQAHVATLEASIPTLEHHERPEYLDRLAVLRNEAYTLDHMFTQLFAAANALIRLLITVGLLVSVSPVLAALVVFAIPTVLVSSWRSKVQLRAEEGAAPRMRLAHHLFLLATTESPAKETRLSGLVHRLVDRRRDAWQAWHRPIATAHRGTAWWQTGAWALFGAAYVGAIVLTTTVLRSSPGDVLLVLAAGSRLSQYVGMAAAQTDFLRFCIDASKRLAWLDSFANVHRDTADQSAPRSLSRGIHLENVSFRYPGTEDWVLRDVSLDLPAGSVVAIVGENGAGKTTLVKLLSRLYEPTRGRITVDGTDLARIPVVEWRRRLAGAYQDFYNFEFPAQQTIGIGDLERLEEQPAVVTAVDRAGADDVVRSLPHGLETQLGPSWPGGVNLSYGQWQKVALARGFMRDRPLLLVLDEPTAALDAETEHALFERFANRSRADNELGRITVLVSHRFSTVRMADLIVVLQGSRVIDVGSHRDLIDRGGTYAQLYNLQANAYQ